MPSLFGASLRSCLESTSSYRQTGRTPPRSVSLLPISQYLNQRFHRWARARRVELYGAEAGVAGLAPDGGSIGSVAGTLGNGSGPEEVSTRPGERGWVEACVVSTATDSLEDRDP